MSRDRKILLAVLGVVAGLGASASAQIQINTPDVAVIEDFAIGASSSAALPANWKFSVPGTNAPSWSNSGNFVAVSLAASSGSPTTGGRYNWGDGSNTADRAIGFMSSGGYSSPNSILAYFHNSTGETITQFDIAFDVERYRRNTAAASLSFFISSDGSAWTSEANGNIAAGTFATGASSYFFSAPETEHRNFTISGLSLVAGADFYLRWHFNTNGINSQGLGLDNFSITARTGGVSAPRDLTWHGDSDWDDSAAAWFTPALSSVHWDDSRPDNAVFTSGSAGTEVNLVSERTAGRLTFQFAGPQYTLSGEGLRLKGAAGLGLNAEKSAIIRSAVAVDSDQQWSVGVAQVLSVEGQVTGSALTKVGQGTLVLSHHSNGFNGLTINDGTVETSHDGQLGSDGVSIRINGGVLKTTDSLSSGRGLIVDANGGTLDTNGFDSSFAGALEGSGTLTKVGAGTLELATNSVGRTGNTILADGSGTIRISAPAALGSGTLILGNNTTEELNTSADAINHGLTLNNGSTLRSLVDATYSKAGSPVVASGAAVEIRVATGTTLTVNSAFRMGGSGAIIGVNDGVNTGTLHLTSGSAGSGVEAEWRIHAGTLRVDNAGSLGTSSSTAIVETGAILANGSSSPLVQDAITLAGGTLGPAGGDRIFNSTIFLAPSSTSTISQEDLLIPGGGRALTFNSPVSGAGNLIIAGHANGIVVFSHPNNDYAGTTHVQEGTLRVNGSLTGGGAVTLDGGTTLGGSGSITGPVTIGGIVSPGASAGVLTFAGGADLSNAAYHWELVALGETDRGINFDGINIAGGTLTLGGSSSLNIVFTHPATDPDHNDPFWASPRSWKVVDNVGAARSGNFTSLVNNTYAAGTFSLAEGVGADDGDLFLNFAPAINGSRTLIWDPDGSTSGGTDNSGEWDITSPNWYFAGTVVAWSNGNPDRAIFGTGGGGGSFTISLDDPITASSILFAANSPVYTIDSSTITLVGNGLTLSAANSAVIESDLVFVGAQTWDVSASQALTVAGAALGGSLTKTGAGTLSLTNPANSISTIVIDDGTLAVSGGGALGGAALTMAGGTLRADGPVNSSSDIDFPSGQGGGTIDTNGHDVTLSGALSGSAPFIKTGAGVLTLDGIPNSRTGTTTISGGTLRITTVDSSGVSAVGTSSLTVESGATFHIDNVHLGTMSDNVTPGTGVNLTLKDGATLLGTGDASFERGGSPKIATNSATIKFTTAAVGDTLTIRTTLRNDASASSSDSTIIVGGPGRVLLVAGATSLSLSADQFSGSWQVDGGLLQLGPAIFSGSEPFNALGYTAGDPIAGARPVTVNPAGTLAGGKPSSLGNYKSPITLAGGTLASAVSSGDGGEAAYSGTLTLQDGATFSTTDPNDGSSTRSIAIISNPGTPGDISWSGASHVTGKGTVTFNRTGVNVSVAADAELRIHPGATVRLNGQNITSDGVNWVDIENNSTSTFIVESGSHSVGDLAGVGNTIIASGASLTAFNVRQNSLSIQGTGSVSIRPLGDVGGTSTLSSLSMDGGEDAWTGRLDLADNDLIVYSDSSNREAALATLTNMIKSGRNSNLTQWTGSGITSSTAANDITGLTGLAIILNDDDGGHPLYTTFSGQSVDENSILIKYAWNGDMDLSGTVDADDYFRIDSGFAGNYSGYRNGDLDYSGAVDADDYFLIDSAFAGQSGPLAAGAAAAVPEPGAATLCLAMAAIACGRRRRREQ